MGHDEDCECVPCNTPFEFFGGISLREAKREYRRVWTSYKDVVSSEGDCANA